jgi:hypothetical protein
MTDKPKQDATPDQGDNQLYKEELPVPGGTVIDKSASYKQLEDELNAKILAITMTIKDHYPELYKHIEEMPQTIPNKEQPEITLNNLRSYYESLNTMLADYKAKHPKTSNQ